MCRPRPPTLKSSSSSPRVPRNLEGLRFLPLRQSNFLVVVRAPSEEEPVHTIAAIEMQPRDDSPKPRSRVLRGVLHARALTSETPVSTAHERLPQARDTSSVPGIKGRWGVQIYREGAGTRGRVSRGAALGLARTQWHRAGNADDVHIDVVATSTGVVGT